MKREKSCGAIITRNDLRNLEILLIHQVQGHWSFPKGHVEEGETELQTASREIKEETNVDVTFEDGFRMTTEYSPKPDVIKEVVYFIAHPVSADEKPQLSEVQELKWVTLVEADSLLTYDSDAHLLKKAYEFLKLQENEND